MNADLFTYSPFVASCINYATSDLRTAYHIKFFTLASRGEKCASCIKSKVTVQNASTSLKIDPETSNLFVYFISETRCERPCIAIGLYSAISLYYIRKMWLDFCKMSSVQVSVAI